MTHEDLKKLQYMDCVQKEVLRMDSSIGMVFPRIAQKDHYLGNLKIYKGMVVSARIRSVHYREDCYRDPLEFIPERWMQKQILHPYAYIPFSAGARNCIGNHLSLLENKIFMVELLRKYKSIIIDKERPKMLMTTLYGPEPVKTTFSKF